MRRIAVVVLATFALAAPARAQLMDVLTAPKTLIDRAIEARSASDIAKDNLIVAKVNGYMGKNTTIQASTEIYEQRLLVTGLFDDKATYDQFQKDVRSIEGVRKLYWQVTYLAKDDARRKALPSWADTVEMGVKAQARLIGTKGVADVNFRTTVDSYGNLYVIGRARSQEEANKAIARLKEGEGIKKVVNYIDVRP
ncbi:BON domain-containing protein [Magnetospirillum sp. 15-1]|uniref:BON domain-containing protein n=1 Tax=Magnetospirillum sp. 15-1 TaxID=1979370 RepID=UPI000BBC75E9|nr:BON domain-containing protein [Magnetospirillum sp. 15-1]